MMRSENVIGRIMRVISIAISVMLVVIVLVICAQTFFSLRSVQKSLLVGRGVPIFICNFGVLGHLHRNPEGFTYSRGYH